MRRLVDLSMLLVALTVIAAGCRHDGREMRPALPSQIGSVSTTAPPTAPATDDDFFDTVATDAALSSDGTLSALVPAGGVTAPWRNGSTIDPRYTCKGANVAPALSWTEAPEGTQEIAVTMIDEDFNFDHWTLSGIAPDVTALAENTTPEGAVAALNGNGAAAYTGPCPPARATHTYRITIHYLDRALKLAAGGRADDMRAQIEAATIATAQVTGTFTGS